MVSDPTLWLRLKATALAALSLVLVNAAHAAEYDCETMAFKLKPGDMYEFKLEIQTKIIRLELGEDFCQEPAKEWFDRQLILPRPGKRQIPLPGIKKLNTPLPPSGTDNAPLPGQAQRERPLPDLGLAPDDSGAAPLPIQREFVKPGSEEDAAETGGQTEQPAGQVGTDAETDAKTHVSTDAETDADLTTPDKDAEAVEEPVYGVVAPPPPTKDDTLIKRCDRELSGFWSPGEHEIDGRKYWLAGVFTIDLNSDGRVDDVGFKLKAKGRIGNIVNYFPSSEGRLSGKTIDSLALEEDEDVHRLCPDNLTFERPGAAEELKKRKATEVKALKAESKKKEEEAEEEEPVEEEVKKKDVDPVIFIVGAIALVLLLAGGVGLAFAARNMMSSKDEYEEIEEDDD